MATTMPSVSPTVTPTMVPTVVPTTVPSKAPTLAPTLAPARAAGKCRCEGCRKIKMLALAQALAIAARALRQGGYGKFKVGHGGARPYVFVRGEFPRCAFAIRDQYAAEFVLKSSGSSRFGGALLAFQCKCILLSAGNPVVCS